MQLVLPKGKVRGAPVPFYVLFYKAFLKYSTKKTGMEITINQQQHSIPDDYSVSQLLAYLMPGTETGIAVAINHNIISRSEWQSHKLHAKDNVMLIKATQGG